MHLRSLQFRPIQTQVQCNLGSNLSRKKQKIQSITACCVKMPVLGPPHQLITPQPTQMATMGYQGYGGVPHPLRPPVPSIPNAGTFPSMAGYLANPGMAGSNVSGGGTGIIGMTMHDQAEAARMAQDYEALVAIIKQWNANRLDLFALTLPNEVWYTNLKDSLNSSVLFKVPFY